MCLDIRNQLSDIHTIRVRGSVHVFGCVSVYVYPCVYVRVSVCVYGCTCMCGSLCISVCSIAHKLMRISISLQVKLDSCTFTILDIGGLFYSNFSVQRILYYTTYPLLYGELFTVRQFLYTTEVYNMTRDDTPSFLYRLYIGSELSKDLPCYYRNGIVVIMVLFYIHVSVRELCVCVCLLYMCYIC